LLISESEAVGFDYCKLRVVVATAKPVAAGADRGHNFTSLQRLVVIADQRSAKSTANQQPNEWILNGGASRRSPGATQTPPGYDRSGDRPEGHPTWDSISNRRGSDQTAVSPICLTCRKRHHDLPS
jgi:hypothetical protein